MNREHASIIGTFASGILLLFTGNMIFFLTLLISACYGGWKLGQRLIPADAGAQ